MIPVSLFLPGSEEVFDILRLFTTKYVLNFCMCS